MLDKEVSVSLVFDRKKKAANGGNGAVELEIYANGKRKYVSTKILLKKGQFYRGKVIGHPDAMPLNLKLKQIIDEVNTWIMDTQRKNMPCTLESFDAYFHRGAKKVKIYKSFVDWMYERIIARKMADGTRKHHLSVHKCLAEEYDGIRLFSDLTPKNIKIFDDWLKNKGLAQTTIRNYHKIIKVYCNEARDIFGLLQTDPYAGLHISKGNPKERVILTKDEIEMFMQAHCMTDQEEIVKDLFTIQIYTGLAFVDMMKLSTSDIQKVGKEYIICKQREKTEAGYMVALHPIVLDVFRKYNFCLPKLCYDQYNDTIKIVAARAGITKRISTHVGRHTFATTVALGSGVPIQVVSKMLGHKSIKTTQVYTHIQTDDVLDALKKMRKK